MDISNLTEELDNIQDEGIRNLTRTILEKAPPHFWYRPASSTGKYHCKEENGAGGLVIHTKRVCKVGELLIETWIPPLEADVVRSACILHDICKYGNGYSAFKYTTNEHPLLAAELIRKEASSLIPTGNLVVESLIKISNAVASHMGKWSTTPFEPEPENLAVHLADYIATKIHEEVK